MAYLCLLTHRSERPRGLRSISSRFDHGDAVNWGFTFGGQRSVVAQRCVEVAAAEAFEVEGDVAVARGLHRSDHGLPLLERGRELVEGDLEAGGVAVVTDTKGAEAEGAQPGLGPLDGAQHPERDRGSVRDSGRKARGGRLVPRAETGV